MRTIRELEPPRFELAKSGEELDIRDVTVIMPIAGKGIRAREVTKDIIPKPLIELEPGRTILDTICEAYKRLASVNSYFASAIIKNR